MLKSSGFLLYSSWQAAGSTGLGSDEQSCSTMEKSGCIDGSFIVCRVPDQNGGQHSPPALLPDSWSNRTTSKVHSYEMQATRAPSCVTLKVAIPVLFVVQASFGGTLMHMQLPCAVL